MVFVWACGRKDRALAGEWDRVRLNVLRERQGWGVGPLANKVWIQPVSLAGSAPRPLRVEFLLKTESGYLRDTGVTWFTLANP